MRPPNLPGPWRRLGRAFTQGRPAKQVHPSSTMPPDNVAVVTGTWGIDFDQDLSTLASSLRSIRFNATTPATGPSIQSETAREVEGSRWYTATITWRAGRASAGDTLAAVVDWYDRADAFISSSTIYAAATIAAGGAFSTKRVNVKAPVTARGARIRVAKAATNFEAWLDAWDIGDAVPSGSYTISPAQSVPGGIVSATVIVMNSIVDEYGLSMNTATGELAILDPGFYAVTAAGSVASLANGCLFQPTLGVLGGGFSLGVSLVYNATGAAADTYAGYSDIVRCVSGTVLTFRAVHDDSVNRDVSMSAKIARVA